MATMNITDKPRTDEEIVKQTNDLARICLAHVGTGFEAPAGHKFYDAQDPRSKAAWQRACEIMEHMTATDPNDALANIEAEPTRYPSPHWRDHLSQGSRGEKAFEYYEVRPCIELMDDEETTSYVDWAEFETALADVKKSGNLYNSFWTVYGRYDQGGGEFLAEAIADRATKEDAFELMNAILAVPAAARWMLEGQNVDSGHPYADGKPRPLHTYAHDMLDDLCNQSSRDSEGDDPEEDDE